MTLEVVKMEANLEWAKHLNGKWNSFVFMGLCVKLKRNLKLKKQRPSFVNYETVI